ncbi:unnamed protein product [Camellia sinensis]
MFDEALEGVNGGDITSCLTVADEIASSFRTDQPLHHHHFTVYGGRHVGEKRFRFNLNDEFVTGNQDDGFGAKKRAWWSDDSMALIYITDEFDEF